MRDLFLYLEMQGLDAIVTHCQSVSPTVFTWRIRNIAKDELLYLCFQNLSLRGRDLTFSRKTFGALPYQYEMHLSYLLDMM